MLNIDTESNRNKYKRLKNGAVPLTSTASRRAAATEAVPVCRQPWQRYLKSLDTSGLGTPYVPQRFCGVSAIRRHNGVGCDEAARADANVLNEQRERPRRTRGFLFPDSALPRRDLEEVGDDGLEPPTSTV